MMFAPNFQTLRRHASFGVPAGILFLLAACDIPGGQVQVPGNSAPVVASVSLSPTSPGTSDVITASVVASDPDGDPVTLSYTFLVNSAVVQSGQSNQLDGATSFSRGDVVRVTVTASDGVDDSTAESAPVTIADSPSTVDVVLDPADPTLSSPLTCTASVADPDGDVPTVSFRWTVDGVDVNATGNQGLVSTLAGAFAAGQLVACTAAIEVPEGASDTDSVTITNSAPSVLSVSLDPDPVRTSDTLTASAMVSDPDGDALTLTYAWTVNGVVVQTGPSEELSGSAWFGKGDVVDVTVTVNDGLAMGTGTSGPVTVADTSATVSVSLTPIEAKLDSALSCTATVTDADGDSPAVTLAWTVSGSSVPATGADGLSSSLSGAFVSGDRVSCTATLSDGPGSDSGSVTIENTAPTVSSVVLSPDLVRTNDVLSAIVSTADVDGDAVTLTYAWSVNGSVVQSGASNELSGDTKFNRDDEVFVTVSATDGIGSGTASSAPVTISDTSPTAPAIEITPIDPVEGDDLVCSVVTPSTDADQDSISYAFAWTVQGAAYAGATDGPARSTVSGLDVFADDTWTCSATASAGGAESAVVEAPVHVLQCTDVSDAVVLFGFSGDMDDKSGYRRLVTPFGAVSLAEDRFGRTGQALAFGAPAYLEIPSSADFNRSEMTWSVWFKTDSMSYQTLFSRSDFADAAGEEFYLGIDPTRIGGELEFAVKQGSNCSPGLGWQRLYAPADISLNVWHHAAAVFENGSMKSFFDGELVGEMNSLALTFDACGGDLHLGAHWSLGKLPFSGIMDDALILPRSLDQSIIRRLAAEPESCRW